MTRGRQRCWVAGALAALILLPAAGARADEFIARRLAALKVLANPQAARPEPAAALSGEGVCPRVRWWRITEYGVRSRIDTAIRDASLRFRTDPELIESVIRHESGFDVYAVSHRGAMGLMQLMPATAETLGVVCPFDPRENILAGPRYLRQLYERLGSWSRALAGYPAGPGRVESDRIPAETRVYVRRVLGSWKRGGPRAPRF